MLLQRCSQCILQPQLTGLRERRGEKEREKEREREREREKKSGELQWCQFLVISSQGPTCMLPCSKRPSLQVAPPHCAKQNRVKIRINPWWLMYPQREIAKEQGNVCYSSCIYPGFATLKWPCAIPHSCAWMGKYDFLYHSHNKCHVWNGHIMFIYIYIEQRKHEKHLQLLNSGTKLFITFEFKGFLT